ncbi:hypothetical protein SNE40_006130 [Patella caerulea]|uniref:Uncharacterized protein n=1 Tax=Patella caerulea TaxID=87958 RepID=A0AAN8K0U7_PATCE
MNECPVLLYAHPSMKEVAKQIVLKCQGNWSDSQTKRMKIERSIARYDPRSVEYVENIQWEKFNDGFPNLFIQDVRRMAGKDVILIGSFHNPEIIFEQISILYAMPRYLAKSFHFILPYFPTGTMERVEKEGQIATAMTLAKMLSNIPLTTKGPAQIMILDIHSLSERFYFSENVIPRLETAVPLLKKVLENRKDLTIAFPDDGAHKRFHSQFPDKDLIICNKIRDQDKRIVQVKEGNPAGKHVVIVDDLVQTGGTLIECGKALLEKGATGVSAYVTHAVFPKDSWKKFTKSNIEAGKVQFESFWITDSIPHAAEIAKHEPFKLLSICDVIAESLLGYDLLP